MLAPYEMHGCVSSFIHTKAVYQCVTKAWLKSGMAKAIILAILLPMALFIKLEKLTCKVL